MQRWSKGASATSNQRCHEGKRAGASQILQSSEKTIVFIFESPAAKIKEVPRPGVRSIGGERSTKIDLGEKVKDREIPLPY